MSLHPQECVGSTYLLQSCGIHYLRSIHTAYVRGLITSDIYEFERAGAGFNFASDIGIRVIDVFLASTALDNETWEVLKETAEQARAYCLDSKNICLERYEPLKKQ